MKKYDLSIIVPLFNEEDSIIDLYSEIKKAVIKNFTYELIFINDGSSDNSSGVIKQLIKEDINIRLIDLFKNRGKAEALNSGFNLANGDIVVTLDGDLQDDPDEIPRLVNKINEGFDMVSGWKKNRKDPLSKIFPSKFFNYF